MKRKSLQVRMAPGLHEKVSFFAEKTGTSMNKLVLDALDSYLGQLSVEVESELSETLRRVRGYSASPTMEDDLTAFVDAEASLHDPAEGQVIQRDEDKGVSARTRRILAGMG